MASPRPNLPELRRLYVEEARPLPRAVQCLLEADPRGAAKAILQAVQRRRHANRAEAQRVRKMLSFEREHWAAGLTLVAGVDEAGMSPLAGPVMAAAVILPLDCRLWGCDDSKKLAPEEREALAPVIREKAVAWAVGQASPEEIDRVNIYHAGLLAMLRAVQGLPLAPEVALVDGRRIADYAGRQVRIVGGDAKSLTIAAASILAKTTRDRLMVELDAVYPGYGLAQHKGYPVREHRDAIRKLGLTPIHRRSFPALWRALGVQPELPLLGDHAP